VVRYAKEEGRVKVYGGPQLKATQAYPKMFGVAMAKLYSELAPSLRTQATNHMAACSSSARPIFRNTLDLLAPNPDVDPWHDACLMSVFEFVQALLLRNL
jgi:hypothetical protein